MTAEFWQTWKEFEVRHGNEDTMREMLRIKRSVQATYNTQVGALSALCRTVYYLEWGIEHVDVVMGNSYCVVHFWFKHTLLQFVSPRNRSES